MPAEGGEPAYDAAYQGSIGAFSEDAAVSLLGEDARLLPRAKLEQVFEAVSAGSARCGVVPVENTLAGSIIKTHDLLVEHDLTIVGETIRAIDQALIALPGTTIDDITRVLSHPVALGQCEQFFRDHPRVEAVPVFDTAGAFEMIAREGIRDAGAIAGRRAADLYGGVVLAERIQDHADNYTRFLLLAAGRGYDRPPPRADKSTIVVKVENVPGALVRALTPLASRGLDLSRIESRPIRSAPFEYLFFFDVLDGVDDGRLAAALDELRHTTLSLRVLGTYGRGHRV
jgi:prephenate dehydratase